MLLSSGARCRLFAYGPADAAAIPKPHHLLPHFNPDWFYLSGTEVVLSNVNALVAVSKVMRAVKLCNDKTQYICMR